MKKRQPPTRSALLALVALLALLHPAAVEAVDPFYENLALKGSTAYRTGDYAAAAETLRLACFGYLDEPEPLTGCLVQLALAQVKSAGAEPFLETFHRILEVEQRFGAYASAEIPEALRSDFEDQVRRNVPVPILTDTEGFAHLVEIAPPAETQPVPDPAQVQAAEVEALLEAARDEAATGSARKARKNLNKVLDMEPDNREAHQLLGVLEADRKHWDAARIHLEAAGSPTTDPAAAAAMLAALVGLERYTDALAYADQLPADLRASRTITALTDEAADNILPPAPAQTEVAEPPPSEPSPVATEAPAPLPVATQPPAPQPTPTPTAVPRRAAASPTPILATEPPPSFASSVSDITWRSSGDQLIVLIKGDQRLDTRRVRHSRLNEPPRHLIRLLGIAESYRLYTIDVSDSDLLKTIRTGVHVRDGVSELHVVLDLSSPDVIVDKVAVNGNTLQVMVTRH